ncbi:uncharacterized protein LOC115455404 [Manduca sexta]|uniref:uncharacterized protein LOC115455404 n=1 Tax=Manduca sexta TaxID=7130 RepID=UPI0018903695|nr:uncharacterized protein LOC115455404 [Manduca sexta]
MKNVAALKTNTNSPKTPGGISKSLLTPCRRVGLSRNWKKSGPSPFISPLASSVEGSQERPKEIKKKDKEIDEKCESPLSPCVGTSSDVIVDKTPTRSVALPRKKKSKTLLAAISSSETSTECDNENLATENDDNVTENLEVQNKFTDNVEKADINEVSSPVRVKSKSKSKKKPSQVQSSQDSNINNTYDGKGKNKKDDKFVIKENSKDKSPNELKKECIVVIQRKIFKDVDGLCQATYNISNKETVGNTSSQTLFDSDSDDKPLCQLNKTDSQKSIDSITKGSKKAIEVLIVNEDNDFVEHKSKIRKLETSKDKPKIDIKKTKKKNEPIKIIKDKPNSFDDDEDFDFDNKKTILIRKTYEKVHKPLKAKSTGSITQKDIDELKARIELKKKILLAKTISEDTKELRDLIKKWQKGCQDALMELMDLMRKKFPEKSNMDYSEILETLHIPAPLVGYDSENDSFNTPKDENIVLSHVYNS